MSKSFPFIKQYDSMECGIACLHMVCKFHGKDYSLDYLSDLCNAGVDGVSMLGISEAAKKLGMNTMCGKLHISQLAECPMPCVLHWNQNHFVVLYKVKGGKFYIADPGKGLLTYNVDDFGEHWLSTVTGNVANGIALFFEPTQEFYEHKDDPHKEERRSFRFLLRYVNKYRRYFFKIVVTLVLGCAFQLILPFLTQSVVDEGIKTRDIDLVWLILIGELFIVLSRTFTDFIRRRLLMHISMRINVSLVNDFFIKLLKLPMAYFDTKMMGDLLQRKNDHNRVEAFLTSQVLNMMFTAVSFAVFGVVLFIYDKLIFGVFIAGSLLYGLWVKLFLNKRRILDYEMFEQQAANNNKTYQFITTLQEIKLQGCERRRCAEWETTQTNLFDVQMKGLDLQQTQEAGSVFINEAKNIIITAISAMAVIEGDMTLGMMLAVQYIIGQLNSPVEQFMRFVYSLQDVRISLERINEIHGKADEDGKERTIKEWDCGFYDRHITIKNLDFKYNAHNPKKTLDNINLSLPYGKVTAIVGASGSGKTTLVKLLLGYYPLLNGDIMVNGYNMKDMNLKWWRKSCGAVMQDGVIFSESIARNIAVGDGSIDTLQLEYAARVACIHDYIMSLPLKYNTIIGQDGVGLSQGQKQRILIARMVYRDPSFVFLDEATNSLDANNERAIVENLKEFYEERLVVVVAHRLSTVKNADQIVVLDDGHVVETGDHETLIAKRGAYYDLVKNQLELGT